MKKQYLLAFVLPLILMACSEDKEAKWGETGSLYIASTISDVDISVSRAEADVNQFTLFLEHESDSHASITGLFSDFPHGTIENIPVGKYTLKLTSHPDGFVPAFEDPWYEGVVNQVLVTTDKTTMVTVDCVQANAGITFVYDPSLEQMGLADIVPVMRQGETSLFFEGENREAKAYFEPGQVELKIKLGDTYLKIGGKETQILNLDKEQLWETTLKATSITGKLGIIAKVKVITDPTNFIEFELGGVDTDPVAVQGLDIGSHTASFLAKGEDVESVKFGVFATSSVDFMLGLGMTLEGLMEGNGAYLTAGYLAQLNSEEGLIMNFDGMAAESEYTLLLMPVKNSVVNVQRYDFVTAEGIKPDPVQDPDGPIVPGKYKLNIYQEESDGQLINPYENEIIVTKAVQENIYIINNLFLISDIYMIAEYNESQGKLTFTGKDIEGYDIFNNIAFLFNEGEYYAGIYLNDGTHPVDKLVFNVVDRQLSDVPTVMEFHLFDPMTEEDLGWMEMSPANNPFTYVGLNTNGASVQKSKASKFSVAETRAGFSRSKGKTGVYASVSVLH